MSTKLKFPTSASCATEAMWHSIAIYLGLFPLFLGTAGLHFPACLAVRCGGVMKSSTVQSEECATPGQGRDFHNCSFPFHPTCGNAQGYQQNTAGNWPESLSDWWRRGPFGLSSVLWVNVCHASVTVLGDTFTAVAGIPQGGWAKCCQPFWYEGHTDSVLRKALQIAKSCTEHS